MRLGISKSKNTINYYIIKDYTKNGKRSTKHVERIGNLEEVKKIVRDKDYKIWLKEYVSKYNEEHGKREIITIKKLYNQFNMKNICDSISDKYKFKFDLSEILSYLVYARIIYPSSKLEIFKQCYWKR